MQDYAAGHWQPTRGHPHRWGGTRRPLGNTFCHMPDEIRCRVLRQGHPRISSLGTRPLLFVLFAFDGGVNCDDDVTETDASDAHQKPAEDGRRAVKATAFRS